jgi:hypothetical protein
VTADQRFTITIALISLVFTILCVLLGVTIRAIVRFTRTEDRVAQVAEDLVELGKRQEATNDKLDRRLTWLERARFGNGPSS